MTADDIGSRLYLQSHTADMLGSSRALSAPATVCGAVAGAAGTREVLHRPEADADFAACRDYCHRACIQVMVFPAAVSPQFGPGTSIPYHHDHEPDWRSKHAGEPGHSLKISLLHLVIPATAKTPSAPIKSRQLLYWSDLC